MDKKLKSQIEAVRKINKDIFKKQDSFIPMCFVFRKNKKLLMVCLPFKNDAEKEAIKNALKKIIVEQEVMGYLFCSDYYATTLDPKTNEGKTIECFMEIFCSPNECVCYSNFYDKDKNFTKEVISNDNFDSDWNLWNKIEIPKDVQDKYNKYKENHKERFK